ncbi:iron-containing alcohol dehydrogenase [Chlorogloeopsis sp. ULAP02]|uniref:iron-containing alcohol dehydrogenase n=1 Tax=Chlorogloeopsis sp. ULAP02 TaxID=3107926 RepID=UPI003135993D
MQLVVKSLPTAYKDGKNEQARSDMTYAEFLAGMAFNNASLCYVHAMSHQIGGVYHNLAHGAINAVLMPYVEAYNAEAVPDRFIAIAEAMGAKREQSTDQAIDYVLTKIRALNQELNIPSTLAELGVEESAIPHMAANALKDPCCYTHSCPCFCLASGDSSVS